MLNLVLSIAFVVASGVSAAANLDSSSTDRIDCPGKIVCPLTGDLVCSDRCPLDAEQIQQRPAVPSCCQNPS